MAKSPATDNCPICQDELNGAIHTLPCAHRFHADCIQKWIELRNLCPLCQQVADVSRPVRELHDDRADLSQQVMNSLMQGGPSSTFRDLLQLITQVLPHDGGDATVMFVDFVNLVEPAEPVSDVFDRGLVQQMVQQGRHIGISMFQPHEIPPPRRAVPAMPPVLEFPASSIAFPPLSMAFPATVPSPITIPIPSSLSPPLDFAATEPPDQAQCANCYVLGDVHHIRRCSGCHQIRYCSRECQEAHWEAHREWCYAHRTERPGG